MQKLSDYIASKTVRYFIYALGAIIAFCIVFQMGVMFSHNHHTRWEFRGMQAHEPGIGLPPPPFGFENVSFPHQMMQRGAPGFVGLVTKTSSSSITAKSRDGDTVHITLSSTTSIRSEEARGSSSTVTNGNWIVVIGEPSDNGNAINAKFIRILPPPPNTSSISR